ncbi:O-methyltransferase [Aestuariivirga sp.]|uniref:O-methyltransferase n=1 Tax=Aestuariivirga sp. TaxID=2650926 RepID=UPI0035B0C03D
MGKTIGLTGALENYYAAHASREAPVLGELRAETAKLGGDAQMQIGPEQGAFMGLLVKLMGARKVIEFGTFTGYSSLAMALAGAQHITCADVSKDFTDIARRYWQKAGVADRIALHLDGGNAVIARALAAGEAGTYDLAFIDADKSGYDAYYEGALKLLRPGGLVLVDNTLWDGDVADPAKQDDDTNAIRALNDKILADDRVEICLVPICDGLTMARKRDT